MGKRKHKKEKASIEVPNTPLPDRSKPPREPMIIPKQIFEAIAEHMLQTTAPLRNVFLSVAEYPIHIINPLLLHTQDSPTHFLVFCLRLLNDHFNPLGTVLINRRVDQSKQLAVVWKAFIQDLSILRLIVIGSLSPSTPTFHDVLAVLTENSKLHEYYDPITYSVWPYKDILHLYDYCDLLSNLQDMFYERVDLYFITRQPSSGESSGLSSSNLKVYSASWTDILLTIASAGINCIYTSNDLHSTSIADLSISSAGFKKTYRKLSKRGLITTDSKPSTDRLLELLWPVNRFLRTNSTIAPHELQTYYDENEDLRILLATARFRLLDSDKHKPMHGNETDNVSEKTGSSIELNDDQMTNIMSIIEDSMKPDGAKPSTPFDDFLQKLVYDDYELFIKTSFAVPCVSPQSSEEQEIVIHKAQLAVAHDHDYFKREQSQNSLFEAQPKSRIANIVKEYLMENNLELPLNLPQSVTELDQSNFPSSHTEIEKCESEVPLKAKFCSMNMDDSKKYELTADDCKLIPCDTPEILKHRCGNCEAAPISNESVSSSQLEKHGCKCTKPNLLPQEAVQNDLYPNRADDVLIDELYNRTMDGLDLASCDTDIYNSLVQSVMDTAIKDFSNILLSYENALSAPIKSDSTDSLAELFDTFDGDLPKIPSKYVIPKCTNLLKKEGTGMSKDLGCLTITSRKNEAALQSPKSDSGSSIDLLNLQETCKVSRKRNLFVDNTGSSAVEELQFLIKNIDGRGEVDDCFVDEDCDEGCGKQKTNSSSFIKPKEGGKPKLLDEANNNHTQNTKTDVKKKPALASCCAAPSTSTAFHDCCEGDKKPTISKSKGHDIEKTDEVTEIDYREYKQKLISTFCDQKNLNCDTTFSDKDTFNKLFNSIPENTELGRVSTDWLCTLKGYVRLKEILERRKVKTFKNKFVCLEHVDFYISLVKRLKNNILPTIYKGADYQLLDYTSILDVMHPDHGLYILTQDEEV